MPTRPLRLATFSLGLVVAACGASPAVDLTAEGALPAPGALRALDEPWHGGDGYRDRCGYGTPRGYDCGPTAFCDYTLPNLSGWCVTVPATCPDVYQPVCGVDRVTTYRNDCYRAQARVAKAHDGECILNRPCSEFPNAVCPNDFVCDAAPGATDGYCVHRPASCGYAYQPVCTADGTTFMNDCFRLQDGRPAVQYGVCNGSAPSVWPGGQGSPSVLNATSAPNDPGYYLATPTVCSPSGPEVCAQNGYTYPNDCLRLMAGGPRFVRVGRCDTPAP